MNLLYYGDNLDVFRHIAGERGRRSLFLALWVVAIIGVCACTGPQPAKSGASPVDDWDRMKDCTTQADRLAARAGWAGSKLGSNTNQGWQSHYSAKYRRCYALVSEMVPFADSPALVYTLHDAFENTVLAGNTNDPRENIQHTFCTINTPGATFGQIAEWNGKKGCEATAAWIEDRMTQ